MVKVPPFFDQEYFYEVVGAGGKLIRVALYKSPKVKKHWTLEEYALLCEHGMVRPATAADMERLQAQHKSLDAAETDLAFADENEAEDI